jgi:hypothetical protein
MRPPSQSITSLIWYHHPSYRGGTNRKITVQADPPQNTRSYSKNKAKRSGGTAHIGDCLSSKHKDLEFIPSSVKKNSPIMSVLDLSRLLMSTSLNNLTSLNSPVGSHLNTIYTALDMVNPEVIKSARRHVQVMCKYIPFYLRDTPSWILVSHGALEINPPS